MEEDITKAIFSTIEEINLQLPRDQRLEATLDAPLFGESGPLDSLGLVNLIVLTEQNVQACTGRPVTLANEEAFSVKDSPFQSVRRLVEYISGLLQKDACG
jgi:D-alanine--poly(phosphoribitol) ligase subunit 2